MFLLLTLILILFNILILVLDFFYYLVCMCIKICHVSAPSGEITVLPFFTTLLIQFVNEQH